MVLALFQLLKFGKSNYNKNYTILYCLDFRFSIILKSIGSKENMEPSHTNQRYIKNGGIFICIREKIHFLIDSKIVIITIFLLELWSTSHGHCLITIFHFQLARWSQKCWTFWEQKQSTLSSLQKYFNIWLKRRQNRGSKLNSPSKVNIKLTLGF